MPAKLIVRVRPDDRVEVKVEGLTERDMSRQKPEKLCKKLTKRLERDLGSVTRCEYEGYGPADDTIVLPNPEDLELGG